MQGTKIKTIVIGLGNPIITDDGVGIKAVRLLREKINAGEITIKELYVGGLRLMETMAGYDRALIIDAIMTGSHSVGTIHELTLSDVGGKCLTPLHSWSTHDTNLTSAIEMGKLAGLKLPQCIKFWAIEVKDITTFSEDLTEEVKTALPVFVNAILKDLSRRATPKKLR